MNSFCENLLVTIIGIVLVLLFERSRRPKLKIYKGFVSTFDDNDPLGRKAYFVYVNVKNLPLKSPLGWFYTRETAYGCKARLDFFDIDGKAIFEKVEARWPNTPEPNIREISHGENLLLQKLWSPNSIDIPPDSEEPLNLVVKMQDNDC